MTLGPLVLGERTDGVLSIFGTSDFVDKELDGLGRRAQEAQTLEMPHFVAGWVVDSAAFSINLPSPVFGGREKYSIR